MRSGVDVLEVLQTLLDPLGIDVKSIPYQPITSFLERAESTLPPICELAPPLNMEHVLLHLLVNF